MSALKVPDLVSVEEYLAGELVSEVRHEYLGGIIYAMAGGKNLHNRIATKITTALDNALSGKPCAPYNSDTKIRIRFPSYERFYYPDASVICRSNPATDPFQDEPVVIFEVLSKATRRIDEGEKKDVYLTIPSLQVYALVEQSLPRIVIFRRIGNEFVREVYAGLETMLPLPEIQATVSLAAIYGGLELVPEDDE